MSSAGPRRSIRLAGASVLGRDHAAFHKNAQDAFACGLWSWGAWGVVSDGCGSGARSEVGAGLGAALVGAALARGLEGDADAPLDTIARGAVASLVDALRVLSAGAVTSQDPRAAEFVLGHLLATLVGFSVRGSEGIVFSAGDGLIAIDGVVTVLDEGDRPSYPAYAVLHGEPRDHVLALGPSGRHAPALTLRRFEAEHVRRIAVATDGFDAELVADAFGKTDPELKRWMNVRSRGGSFRDDATIVTAELEVASP